MPRKTSTNKSRGGRSAKLVDAGRIIGAVAVLLTLGAASGGQRTATPKPLPAVPANGEMGFVLTALSPAIHQGKDDCPEGLAGTVKENYLETLTGPEQSRLLEKANEKELTRRWQAYAVGPNNTNICTNAELFDRPVQKMLQGKVAYGLNLDGDGSGGVAAGSCSHQNFTSPDGAAGVDNQAYRALGCTRNYRGVDGTAGDIVRGLNGLLATGEHSAVLLLRGVDSLVKDDDVEVVLATTDDRPVVDSKMKLIANASFTVSANPRWRNVLHGRIDNGVLTTGPADIRLTRKVGHGGIRGRRQEWDLRQGRLRLAFQPDGSVTGLLGAYQPLRNVIEIEMIGGIGAATTAGIDCAAAYTTLKKLADGLRDPVSGQCNGISSALTVTAIPAFVMDRPPASSQPADRVTTR